PPSLSLPYLSHATPPTDIYTLSLHDALPISLIHAATMVTAGVYMIGRNAVLFGHAPLTLKFVAVIGVATAFFAGTIGLVQNDIRSEEHTSELQSRFDLVCRLLLEKKKKK